MTRTSPTNAAMAARLQRDVANLESEMTIMRRKLSSKTEALVILTGDLDACRTERDQYKLMAEQLQRRHVAIKKQLAGLDEGRLEGDSDQLSRLVADHQAKAKSAALLVEDLKQRLAEAEGDSRALRQQLGRLRLGDDDEAVNRRAWRSSDREALVASVEAERKKNESLKRDMREVFDQKEELVTERDALKTKHERLNREMNLMLKGDPSRILDLDALVMENSYLKQELKRLEEEQTKAASMLSKYRVALERRLIKGSRNKMTAEEAAASSVTPPGSPSTANKSTSNTVSCGLTPGIEALGKKLVKVPPDRATPQIVARLQKFVLMLQESLQDRNLALSHQRKTNRILAQKVQVLEERLREVAPAPISSTSDGRLDESASFTLNGRTSPLKLAGHAPSSPVGGDVSSSSSPVDHNVVADDIETPASSVDPSRPKSTELSSSFSSSPASFSAAFSPSPISSLKKTTTTTTTTTSTPKREEDEEEDDGDASRNNHMTNDRTKDSTDVRTDDKDLTLELNNESVNESPETRSLDSAHNDSDSYPPEVKVRSLSADPTPSKSSTAQSPWFIPNAAPLVPTSAPLIPTSLPLIPTSAPSKTTPVRVYNGFTSKNGVVDLLTWDFADEGIGTTPTATVKGSPAVLTPTVLN